MVSNQIKSIHHFLAIRMRAAMLEPDIVTKQWLVRLDRGGWKATSLPLEMKFVNQINVLTEAPDLSISTLSYWNNTIKRKLGLAGTCSDNNQSKSLAFLGGILIAATSCLERRGGGVTEGTHPRTPKRWIVFGGLSEVWTCFVAFSAVVEETVEWIFLLVTKQSSSMAVGV